MPPGVPRAFLGGLRATFFASLGFPGASLGFPGRRLGRLWRSLGVSLGSGASPGPSLAVSGGLFGVPGFFWVASGDAPGRSLGGSLGSLASPGSTLGMLWGGFLIMAPTNLFANIIQIYHFGGAALWKAAGPNIALWALCHDPLAKNRHDSIP